MGLLDDITTFKKIIMSALTQDLAKSAIELGAMAPFFNALNAISNRCIAGDVTAHTAYVWLTRHGQKPWALMDGVGKAILLQTLKNGARNAIWLKKSDLDEAFPNTSNYIIPAYFASSELLLNPLGVALTRTYEGKPYPRTFKPWFAGSIPGCLKLTATSAIYVHVKSPIDNLIHTFGINPNSTLGACLSAPLIATSITLLTHPFEHVRRTLQFAKNEHLTFFGATRNLANTFIERIQEKGLQHALCFLLRGWAPALTGNIGYTLAFNLLIFIGANSTVPSASASAPSPST